MWVIGAATTRPQTEVVHSCQTHHPTCFFFYHRTILNLPLYFLLFSCLSFLILSFLFVSFLHPKHVLRRANGRDGCTVIRIPHSWCNGHVRIPFTLLLGAVLQGSATATRAHPVFYYWHTGVFFLTDGKLALAVSFRVLSIFKTSVNKGACIYAGMVHYATLCTCAWFASNTQLSSGYRVAR